jgi:hypothetical protein
VLSPVVFTLKVALKMPWSTFATSFDDPSRYDQPMTEMEPEVLAFAMNVAREPADGKPAYETPLPTSVGSFARAVSVSLVLSKVRPAPAPLIATAPFPTTVTVKVPPVAGGLMVFVVGTTLIVFVLPVSADAIAGSRIDASRQSPPAIASRDRST